MEKLRIRSRNQGQTMILDMSGDLSGLAESVFQNALEFVEKNQPGGVILNFSEVDYINSTGIGLVVRLLNQAKKTSQPVAAYGVKSYYVKIFEYTRISQYMPIYPDETTALTAMQISPAGNNA